MKRLRVATLLSMCALLWAGLSGQVDAQWSPYLPPYVTAHAIMGHVAGLGPVIRPDGKQYILEHDDQGLVVGEFELKDGMFTRSGSSWNFEVRQWTDARDAAGAGNSEKIRADAYKARQCYDTDANQPGEPPPVSDDATWVLVRRVTQGLVPCDSFVLTVSTLPEPDILYSDSSFLLINGGEIVESGAGHVFALESGYFEAEEGYCPNPPGIVSPVLSNLVAYQACRASHVTKLWAPIEGAQMETSRELGFYRTPTTGNGFFRIDYWSRGFDDESGTWVWGEVQLDAFNPRFPSSRKFYLKRRVTGAGTVRNANFAIDLVQAHVNVLMFGSRKAQQGETAEEAPVHVVDLDYQFDEFTEYAYLPGIGQSSEPGFSYEPPPVVDLRDIGLVQQISAIDLQLTDVYLYRVADGKLVGARRGMTPNNLVGVALDPIQFPNNLSPGEAPWTEPDARCNDKACLGFVMLSRGPASLATAEGATSLGGTAPYQSAVASTGGSPNQVSLELEYLASFPAVDFLRPGDAVQLVVVNRVTGYIGSTYGRIENSDKGLLDILSPNPDSGQLGVVNVDGDFGLTVEMRPPNLRVTAKRRFIVAGGQTDKAAREYIIGFEGASLNTDDIVEITTEWVDHDGKPLPEGLPGFTGRLASVLDDQLVPEGGGVETPIPGADQVGHFAIRPGRHTQVARVPLEHAELGHLYIHIDAAPSDETIDFENALIEREPSFAVNKVCYGSDSNCIEKSDGGEPNPLDQRPAHFVPFQVPIFDEAATRQAAVAQRAQLQEDWIEGQTIPILGKVEPIHKWVYRPEFRFSILELEVNDKQIVTDDQGTRMIVDYTLTGTDDTRELDPFGDSQFVFSLGYRELLATVFDGLSTQPPDQLTFEDLSELLAETTGGQLGGAAALIGAVLGPEDYLMLQLYSQHDSYNGLYEFAFGSDFNVFADVRTLELERIHGKARYSHHGNIPQPPPYRDTYEFLSFEVMNTSEVEIMVFDQDGGQASLLLSTDEPPGQYRAVVYYEQLLGLPLNLERNSRFRLEIQTRYLDENGEPASHTIAYEGVLREREEGEVIGQNIVNDVAIADGSLRLEREDFRIPGAGPDLALVRTYSSTNVASGPLGPGWRHNLQHQLVPLAAGIAASMANPPAGVPTWVANLGGKLIGAGESTNAPTEWVEVVVNGTHFRKYETEWYPERGRHSSLEERVGAQFPEFVFTAMDGTKYRYKAPATPDKEPDPGRDIPVTVSDAAVYRIGLPPLNAGLPCLVQSVLDITSPNQHKLEFTYSDQNAERPDLGVCGLLREIKEFDAQGVAGRIIALEYGSESITSEQPGEAPQAVQRLQKVLVAADDAYFDGSDIEITFDYDSRGRLWKAERATRLEQYGYDGNETDAPLASTTVAPLPIDEIQQHLYTYHEDGELTLVGTPYGEALTAERIVKTVTLPAVQSAVPDFGSDSVDFQYDFTNNSRAITDGRGLVTQYELDDVGRPTRIDAPLGRQTTLAWDSNAGLVSSRTEITVAGLRTTDYGYAFDPQSHRLTQTSEQTSPSPIDSPSAFESRVTIFDPKFNKPTRRTDRNGFQEDWIGYDEHGNPSQYVDGAGSTWTFGYDGQNLLESRTSPGPNLGRELFLYDRYGYLENTTSPLGYSTSTRYDARGRLRERFDRNNNLTSYDYDDLDNLVGVNRPVLTRIAGAGDAALVNYGATSRRTSSMGWDSLGRKLSETDHNGQTVSYEYDARGLLRRASRIGPVEPAERTFDYDANGNLRIETDWKGVATTHTYDDLNQRDITTNRVGDTIDHDFDSVGNLLSVVREDATGADRVTTAYGYDILGRRTSMDVTGRGTNGAHVDWQYYNEDDPSRNLWKVTVDRAPFSPTTTEFKINRRYQRVLRIDPGVSQEYAWQYHPDGTLDFEKDQSGLETQYKYDEDSRLRFIHVKAGSDVTTELKYDNGANVIEIIDPLARHITREYDEWNRMYRSHVERDGAPYTTEVLYDGQGNVLNVRDPLDHDRSTLRDELGRVVASVAADGGRVDFEYDQNDNLAYQREHVSDRDTLLSVTHVTYDAEDREHCRTEAMGTADVRQSCIDKYDGTGNPVEVKDYRDKLATYGYDANNRVVSALLPGNDTLKWSYSRNGLLASQTDARLNETLFEYDELGRLEKTIDPPDADNNLLFEQRGYDAVGNLTSVKDRLGVDTVYNYDVLHRLSNVEHAGETVSVYGYDAVGNLRFEQDGNCDTVAYCYDERDLVEVTYVPTGDSAAGNGCADGGTDTNLGATCVQPGSTLPIVRTYDDAGNLKTLTNEAQQETRFDHYDPENRLEQVTFAQETTLFTYDKAGLVRTRSRGGVVDSFRYDMLGRLKIAYDGGVSVDTGLDTTYQYDDAGNLERVELPGGAVTNYTYDDRSRVATMVQDPGGLNLTTSYTYDPDDNLDILTDANGGVIDYDHDHRNRRISAIYPAQPGAPFYAIQNIEWTYDGNDNLTDISMEKVGPGGPVTDTTVLRYDSRDRLDHATYRGRDVHYAYDGASQRTGIAVGVPLAEAGLTKTLYQYDARGRVKGVVTSAGTANYFYEPDGRIKYITRPSDVRTDYAYTPQNRVESIQHSVIGTTLAQYDYTYDSRGNRLSETASQIEQGALVERTRKMAYDLADRLCLFAEGQGDLAGVSTGDCQSAAGAGAGVTETRYTFQGYNRATETVLQDGDQIAAKVYGYGGANRLDTVDITESGNPDITLSYGYDNNGNTLSITHSTAPDETMGFVYNPRDQLVQVTRGPPGGEVILGRYDYDAQGQRIRTEALGDPTELVYDGLALLQTYKGGLEEAFVHRGPGGELLGVKAPGTPVQWVQTDVLGSPTVQTDNAGAVVASTRYGVFGDVASREEPGAPQGPRFGFTGHQYDAGTELVYANARYYQPGLGRFLSRDPFPGVLGEPVTQTPYLYAAHSPAVLVDPSGETPINAAAAVGGAVGGFIFGGAISAGLQLFSDEEFSYGQVLAHAVGGAVSGAIAGATLGTGTGAGAATGAAATQGVARFLAIEGAASVAGGTATRAALGEETTFTDVAVDFGIGVATAGTVRGVGRAFKSGAGATDDVIRAADGSASQQAGTAARQAQRASRQISGPKAQAPSRSGEQTIDLVRSAAGRQVDEAQEAVAGAARGRGAGAARGADDAITDPARLLAADAGPSGRAPGGGVAPRYDAHVRARDELPAFRQSLSDPAIADSAQVWQRAIDDGHSNVLRRAGSPRQIRQNRRRSQAEYRREHGAPREGYNLDEYPPASTHQGGTGARIEEILGDPNQALGRRLGAFFREHGIERGDWFRVLFEP